MTPTFWSQHVKFFGQRSARSLGLIPAAARNHRSLQGALLAIMEQAVQMQAAPLAHLSTLPPGPLRSALWLERDGADQRRNCSVSPIIAVGLCRLAAELKAPLASFNEKPACAA